MIFRATIGLSRNNMLQLPTSWWLGTRVPGVVAVAVVLRYASVLVNLDRNVPWSALRHFDRGAVALAVTKIVVAHWGNEKN